MGHTDAIKPPLQNPLLDGATVTDRSAATAAAAAAGTLGLRSRGDMPAPPPRRKVPFEKGYSQMDWVRLTQTHPDLAGLGPGGRLRRGITLAEVAQHSSPDDCWTVLRGKVRWRGRWEWVCMQRVRPCSSAAAAGRGQGVRSELWRQPPPPTDCIVAAAGGADPATHRLPCTTIKPSNPRALCCCAPSSCCRSTT